MSETANFGGAFKKENKVLTRLLMEGEHLQTHCVSDLGVTGLEQSRVYVEQYCNQLVGFSKKKMQHWEVPPKVLLISWFLMECIRQTSTNEREHVVTHMWIRFCTICVSDAYVYT